MRNAIDVRNMHTAIHELFVINHKPMTVLKAFKELSEGINENDNWDFINANTEYLGEINYRFITDNRQYIYNGEKLNLLNNHSYDIYGL